MNTLFLITARGGSKGLPGKNIKKLNGVPLIHYSIDLARQFVSDENICVSTDDKNIISVVKRRKLAVPFIRPSELASDTAGSYEVILHALNWYSNKGRYFDNIVLLQPTSPFRLKKDVEAALSLYDVKLDMVVSTKKIDKNLYSVLYKEKTGSFIEKAFSKKLKGDRRQDSDSVFELNGAIYVFNTKSLKEKKISEFKKIKKVTMHSLNSVDIDNQVDWHWCEFLLNKKLVKLDFKVRK